jgi:hypothetical protein
VTPRAIDGQIDNGIRQSLTGVAFAMLDATMSHDDATPGNLAFDFRFVTHGIHYD